MRRNPYIIVEGIGFHPTRWRAFQFNRRKAWSNLKALKFSPFPADMNRHLKARHFRYPSGKHLVLFLAYFQYWNGGGADILFKHRRKIHSRPFREVTLHIAIVDRLMVKLLVQSPQQLTPLDVIVYHCTYHVPEYTAFHIHIA